ncbi:MAG: hypothetical protein KDE53_01885, partial [Caldilineaceae bacterium]|nr:hypothetical protein [Caldilineaceae bacterium]
PELGPEAFQALLSESKTLLDLLLEKVSNGATNTELIALQKEVIELVASIDDPYQRTNWQNTLPAQLKLGQRQYNNLIKKAVATRRRKETEARLAAIEARRGKPAIQMNDRQLSDITADALDALNTANAVNPRVFIRGGVLSRIIQDERGHYGVQELNEGAMLHIAAEVAAWQNVTESEEGTKITSADPRSAIIKALLNRGEWEGIPALAGIVNAPVFSADGILHSEPGYNAKSRLYYTGGVKVGDTTKRNIKRAKALFFGDLLVDFPFKDDASKAHAIGYLLLPFVRDMIQGPTPVHTVDSPTAGTGKGKLLNSCGYPFLGYDVPTMAAAKDDDEWRKRITTHLMGGSSHLTIDNINHEPDSGSLASAFTQPLWEDRTLGFNREVKIPIRTVWGITANNIKMSQEIARRCVWIRLDANEEKPWLRTEFKHKNLIQWVSEHRNELVTAALTLIQAWIDAGRPKHNGRPKGSYEAWADVIGGILQTVGIDGFLANEDELYERVVSKSDLLADFVKAWWVEFPDKAAPAYELFKLASFSDDDAQNVIGTWHNLLGDMLTSSKERGRQTQLGKILAENQDKVISGYKISFAHASNGVKFWKLEAISVEPHVEPVEPQFDTRNEVLHGDGERLPPVEKGQNTPKVEPVEPVEPFNEIRDRENKFNFTHLDGEKKNISRIGTAEKGSLGSTD